MAARCPAPPRSDSGRSRIVRRTSIRRPGTPSTGPIFTRLTVEWVQRNGVPFNTTGFFASLSIGGTLVATTRFDRFGVARFNNVRTLTTSRFTLRLFNGNGVLFRTRTIPAGIETFVVIG